MSEYLTEDPELRGQKYVCLSFLSPEDLLANKDIFFFENYVRDYAKNLDTLISGLRQKFETDAKEVAEVLKREREREGADVMAIETVYDKYRASVEMLDHIREINPQYFAPESLQDDFRFYRQVNGTRLDAEFHEANKFRTSIRAIKVRGVFETVQEAEIRANVLKKMGDKFDIFVGTVGCWCPWSPNPYEMKQEYAVEALNTLMDKHGEKVTLQDQTFEERKNKAAAAASAGPSGGSAAITAQLNAAEI